MLIQHEFNISAIWRGRRTTAYVSTKVQQLIVSVSCLLYPWFTTAPRFATESLVLQTVSRFATKPRFVTEPSFATATKRVGTVRRNMRVWCVKMCGCGLAKCSGYGATKCAGTVSKNVRVCCEMSDWCGVTQCGNGATECGNVDEMATTSDDRLYFNRWYWFVQ